MHLRAQFPSTASVLVLVMSSQRKMTTNNVLIEWGKNPWSSMDMLIFTPRAESNALITWNMHHWWKKKTYAVNKIYIVFQFLEPQVKRMVRSRELYRWNRGSWKSAPASLCDFWRLEGNLQVLSIFQVFHTESKKKKMYLSGTPHGPPHGPASMVLFFFIYI